MPLFYPPIVLYPLPTRACSYYYSIPLTYPYTTTTPYQWKHSRDERRRRTSSEEARAEAHAEAREEMRDGGMLNEVRELRALV